MTVTGTYCGDTDVVYTATVDGTDWASALTSTWLTFDPATRAVSWDTSDAANAAVYTIVVTGTVTNTHASSPVVTSSESFTLTITTITCAASTETIVMTPPVIADQIYSIGDDLFTLNFDEFTEDSTYCVQADIVYTIAVTTAPAGVILADVETPTGFITLDATTRSISWDTASTQYEGDYTIEITGTITAASTWNQPV